MQFLLLDPRPSERAAMLELLAAHAPALGIEVTVPELAKACSLNIDPQHDGSGADYAAIEHVAGYVEELADFETCATVRADLDSVGAMAVLALYRDGVQRTEEINEKIEAIATYDRFDHGPWYPGVRPPTDWTVRALNRRIGNPAMSLADRVELMIRWLRDELDLSDEVAEAERHAMDAATQSVIKLRGNIAVVTSSIPSRTPIELGYEQAPVVILVNPAMRVNGGEPHLKYGVYVWPGSGALDLPGAFALLRQREPGWGGNVAGGAIGSTQGEDSIYSLEEVFGIVSRFVR